MPSKGGSSASSSEERSSSTSRLTDVTKTHEKWTFLNIRSCLNFLQDCGFLHLFAFEWCKVCGISTLWSLCLKGWPSKKSFIQTTGFKMMRKNNTKVWCFISDYSSSPAPSKGEQQLELVLVFRGIQKCDGYSKAYDTPRVHIFQHLFSNPSGTRNPDENSPKSPRLPLPRHQLFADRNVDPRPGSSIWLAAFLKVMAAGRVKMVEGSLNAISSK